MIWVGISTSVLSADMLVLNVRSVVNRCLSVGMVKRVSMLMILFHANAYGLQLHTRMDSVEFKARAINKYSELKGYDTDGSYLNLLKFAEDNHVVIYLCESCGDVIKTVFPKGYMLPGVIRLGQVCESCAPTYKVTWKPEAYEIEYLNNNMSLEMA